MFRRSLAADKLPQGYPEQSTEKTKCDSETSPILQPVQPLATTLSREEITPNKSDGSK
jgi:hypothetical protein